MKNIDMYRRWLELLASSDEPAIAEPQDFKELCEALRATGPQQGITNEAEENLERVFQEFLSAHPAHRAALRKKLAREAVQQVESAMAHYKEVKTRRPLTDDEKEIGPALVELLSDAQRLLQQGPDGR